MAAIKRIYNCKDVDMLSAGATIVEQAITRKTFLMSKRAIWADPFFANLKTRIANAFSNVLGIDNAKQMREATEAIMGIQKNAVTLLAEFKVQIEEDFKDNKTRKNEILNQLGFTPLLKKVQKMDQEALIELLYQFKLNMTTALKTEITNAGTSATEITDIIAFADTLKNANVTQETLKDSRPEITQTGLTELNQIYEQVISVARIAAKFYKNNKAVKEEFSFAKTVQRMNKPKPLPIQPKPQPPVTGQA